MIVHREIVWSAAYVLHCARRRRLYMERNGNGAYTFYASPEKTEDEIQKHADLDTASYLGKEWRGNSVPG